MLEKLLCLTGTSPLDLIVDIILLYSYTCTDKLRKSCTLLQNQYIEKCYTKTTGNFTEKISIARSNCCQHSNV